MPDERKTGRTTRLVDKYVQEYFTQPLFTPIVIKDHIDDYQHNFELLKKVINRLNREFGENPYSDNRAVLYQNPYMARFGCTNTPENTYCVIIREKDRIQEMRKQQFKMYKDRLYELKIEYQDDKNDDNVIKHMPPLFDILYISRANGQSTRLADEYIQKYFTLKPGEYIEIIDHYGGEGERRAHEYLAKKIADRLKEEHGEKFYFHRAAGYPRIVKVEK